MGRFASARAWRWAAAVALWQADRADDHRAGRRCRDTLLDLLLAVILLLLGGGQSRPVQVRDERVLVRRRDISLLALVSLGVTILMATAVTVVGRSLVIGLTVAMVWYPVENFSIILLILAND